MSFVLPVIMDQIETLPVATDVDSQYDVLIFLSHIVGQLSGDLVRFSHRIFFHLIRYEVFLCLRPFFLAI